jgi:hypothetical protein
MPELNVKSKIIKTELIKWKDLKFIQQENFKSWNREGEVKLYNSILKHQFIDPFKVWENDGIIYCLDGNHRYQDLLKAEGNGVEIPEMLPATFIDCKDIQQAAELVLIYSSVYASINEDGFNDFMLQYDLNIDMIIDEIQIPDIIQSDFLDLPDELTSDPKEKPATLKITFNSTSDLDKAKSEIEDIIKNYPGSYYSISCGEI